MQQPADPAIADDGCQCQSIGMANGRSYRNRWQGIRILVFCQVFEKVVPQIPLSHNIVPRKVIVRIDACAADLDWGLRPGWETFVPAR
jgi:hypothetical protein